MAVSKILSRFAPKNSNPFGAPPSILQLSIKNVNVLTAGAPNDIASITIPDEINRWTLGPNTQAGYPAFTMIVESAAGALDSSAYTLRDAPGGSGLAVSISATGPSAVSGISNANGNRNASSSKTIYIYQTSNSANAGIASFYISLIPINT